MLNPPQQKQDEAPKRSEAVYVTDLLRPSPATGWCRTITYWYEGEDYSYAMEPLPPAPGELRVALTEEDARRRLYGPAVDRELQRTFLREVHLDMTRPH